MPTERLCHPHRSAADFDNADITAYSTVDFGGVNAPYAKFNNADVISVGDSYGGEIDFAYADLRCAWRRPPHAPPLVPPRAPPLVPPHAPPLAPPRERLLALTTSVRLRARAAQRRRLRLGKALRARRHQLLRRLALRVAL